MSPWVTLGLECTDDVAEIRRAYARKLKSIDVDADPEAFVALRRAVDEALHAARMRRIPAKSEDEGETGKPVIDAAMAFEPMQPAPVIVINAPKPDGTNRAEADAERFVRLDALLFGETDGPSDEALVAAVNSILDHPQMDHIEHEASVQHWLADALVASIPRSDPIVPLVVERFGWEKDDGRIDQPWLFQRLVARQRALALIGEIANPDHALHQAYVELNRTEANFGSNRWTVRSDVRRLLTLIRERSPEAEAFLSADRVALWDADFDELTPPNAPTGRSGKIRPFVFAFVILWVLGRVVSCAGQSVSPSAQYGESRAIHSAPGYVDSEADLGQVLSRVAGPELTLIGLRNGNPGLHAQLVERWRQASLRHDNGTALEAGVAELLVNAYGEALRGGSYSLQVEHWQLFVEKLRLLRNGNAEADACVRLLDARGAQFLLQEPLRTPSRSLMANALINLWSVETVPPRYDNEGFTAPAALLAEVSQHFGIGEDMLEAALDGRGTPAQRCDAHIALIDTVLDRPMAEAVATLREMSAGW